MVSMFAGMGLKLQTQVVISTKCAFTIGAVPFWKCTNSLLAKPAGLLSCELQAIYRKAKKKWVG